jgi:hypothetical protein
MNVVLSATLHSPLCLLHVLYENDGIDAGNVWVPTRDQFKVLALESNMFKLFWFWNICEKEYYSCGPVNAGFGQNFPSEIRPIESHFVHQIICMTLLK